MSKKIIIPLAFTILAISIYFLFGKNASTEEGNILVEVEKGEFLVDINTTGELEAKNSVKILGPSGMRRYQIYEVPLLEIIDDGTFVKKGQFVASLDQSPVTTKMQDVQIEVQQNESKYTQTKLDTTLQMKEARNQLINLKYTAEQMKFEFEQSQYEPPAVIKNKQIEYEKAQRAFTQAEENLIIKKQQNIAKMQEVAGSLKKKQLEFEGLQRIASEFTIYAPEDGMLTYHKNWRGVVKAGSQISSWDPVVATLPDLTKMISKTYVNEVDIRNIKKGQIVEVGLDAFPEKKLTGKVINVANVGEQKKNSDAKVFLVNVEINEIDNVLRPAMTTSNQIIINSFQEVVNVPLECLHTQGDSLTYVYKSTGFNVVKQEVKVGATNATNAVIESGLTIQDKVYLSAVKSVEKDEITLLESLLSEK